MIDFFCKYQGISGLCMCYKCVCEHFVIANGSFKIINGQLWLKMVQCSCS